LRQRDPATSVISECLRSQALARPRSRAARFFGRLPLTADALPWYRGALGELEIAQRLGELGPEWHVLHSVPVGTGASDIDHVVVGPAGAFTINTKMHRGKDIWVGSRRILVSGQRTDHLRNSRHEGSRAAQKLSAAMRWTVPVTPLIVFVGVRRFTIREHPADVVVLRDWELTRWLARQPVTLGHLEVAAVAEAAAVPTTWHRTPSLEPADVDAFTALRREVEQARRRRTGWQIGLLLALPAAIAAGANPFITVVGSLVTAVLAR
jgi:Nuclease-related domain